MGMRISLWIAWLLTGMGCATVGRVTLATSTATIACDWGQTREAATRDWYREDGARQHEANPLMGSHPTTRTVDVYFASAILANSLGWYVLPERLRWVVPVVVTARQLLSIRNNLSTTQGVCGI